MVNLEKAKRENKFIPMVNQSTSRRVNKNCCNLSRVTSYYWPDHEMVKIEVRNCKSQSGCGLSSHRAALHSRVMKRGKEQRLNCSPNRTASPRDAYCTCIPEGTQIMNYCAIAIMNLVCMYMQSHDYILISFRSLCKSNHKANDDIWKILN